MDSGNSIALKKVSYQLNIVPSSQNLCGANGSSLNLSCKLKKRYISNQKYCLKNIFTIVKNITNDIILEIPFLT